MKNLLTKMIGMKVCISTYNTNSVIDIQVGGKGNDCEIISVSDNILLVKIFESLRYLSTKHIRSITFYAGNAIDL